MRAEVRHQLKQDRFAVATAETVSWAVEHRKVLTTVGIIAGVVVAVVLAGYYYLEQQNQAASLAMAAAFRTYDAPIVPAGTPPQPGMPAMYNSAADRAKAAQPLFQKVVQNYPHTRNSDIARYFVALTELDLGNTAGAEKQLQDLSGGHNQDLASLAKFALANQYRNSGRDAQAIELYKQLAAHPTSSVSKAQAQLGLAEAYSAKQPDEARKIYQQIQKENPTSPAAEMAASQLSALK